MRKLAWAALSFSAAILLRHYLIPAQFSNVILIALLLLAVCGAILLQNKIRIAVLLICVFGIFGIVRYDLQVRDKIDSVSYLVGQEHSVICVVTEFPDEYDTYSRVTARLATEGYPQTKMMFYVYGNAQTSLVPGDVIHATIKFSSAIQSYGENTDTYISKGIYLRGYLKGDLVVDDLWNEKILYLPQYLAQSIRAAIDTYVPEHAAVFIKALLTGDKSALYEQTEVYNTLTRAGLAHVVAVSGMHVSFLISLVLMLAGNRIGWLFSVAAVALFSVMTGMSPSVMRALFMQLLYLLAPVLKREADGVTSISFALFILLLANPFAIASISLQLSFASMAGILLITPKAMKWLSEKEKVLGGIKKKLFHFAGASFVTSLGATIFTAPLCACYFGSVSLLAPLTNLLVLWLVPYCFAGGFVVCVVSCLSGKIAALLGVLVSWAVEVIYLAAELIAKLPISSVYLPKTLLMCWFAIAYIVIVVTYLGKGSGAYRPLLPLCVIFVSIIAMLLSVLQYYRTNSVVAAIDVGQGQSIAVLDEDETLLIDCGGIYDAADRTAKWLYSHGRYNVDMLIITHFDQDHVNGIKELLSLIEVKEIVCCKLALSEAEQIIYQELGEQAVRCETKVTCISGTTDKTLGNLELRVFVPSIPQENNGVMVLATLDEFDLLVTGDADFNGEEELMANYALPDGECIIAGHHGSKYSTGNYLLDAFNPEISLISCGYNSYGHPSEEVLDRLEERSVVIYRTDEYGTVEVKVK